MLDKALEEVDRRIQSVFTLTHYFSQIMVAKIIDTFVLSIVRYAKYATHVFLKMLKS